MELITQKAIVNKKSESSISCFSCRKKRIRCGRELPKCEWCNKRGSECVYPKKSHRRRNEPTSYSAAQNKLNFKSSSVGSVSELRGFNDFGLNLQAQNFQNNSNEINIFIFEPIPRPLPPPGVSIVSKQAALDLLQPSLNLLKSKKFETSLILLLTKQIVQADPLIVPEIDWFIEKIEHGVFGGITKLTLHINQDWIQELFEPNFKQKVIDSYFKYFHSMVAYISKRNFFVNFNQVSPVLMSVIMYVGYLYCPRQHPELRKYLKSSALIQLKKNKNKFSITNCQAYYIFSYAMLFQGQAKQSIPYFNIACLMASALGIHLDVPNIHLDVQSERHCVRDQAISHDSHLANTLLCQPYYLYLTPLVTIIDPFYQINPFSDDPYEALHAQCVSTCRYLYNRYWMPTTTHMVTYSLLISRAPIDYESEDFKLKIKFFNELLNHCQVQTLISFTNLSKQYQTTEEFEIITKHVWKFFAMYCRLQMILYAQFPPKIDPVTGELNSSTMKAIHAANAIYNIAKNQPECGTTMFYYYLSAISLYYMSLITSLANYPAIRAKLIDKFRVIYQLFNSYRVKYCLSRDIIQLLDIMIAYFKIKL
jgi:hypothetical protein